MTDNGTVLIDGDWFISLHHHDAQFVRRSGRFAFSRLDADGGRTLFCLDAADDISRAADIGHAAWAHAVSRGMNELLVHIANAKRPVAPTGAWIETPPLRFDFQPPDGLPGSPTRPPEDRLSLAAGAP
ncbi:hypothetical protein [Caulobacter sp. UNC279MFTsu5.1]|uniref:hypothetical protein n=1 Tax=Caulobacter sp. UNC279MFTsu5.1 TaxID=1502775 RepID=UPI0008E4ADD5|nr:hypothetical protein [Caulobacter sp. UNC279MFTsu5.1]SFI51720.1 hypothetical protein SAMN02799626_00013 [Caulobacter sp. UNC279MFTsu5.1]